MGHLVPLGSVHSIPRGVLTMTTNPVPLNEGTIVDLGLFLIQGRQALVEGTDLYILKALPHEPFFITIEQTEHEARIEVNKGINLIQLEELLKEISLAEGPYHRNPHQHAQNTIEHMQKLAIQALELFKGEDDE
jgi:hypothetical protein